MIEIENSESYQFFQSHKSLTVIIGAALSFLLVVLVALIYLALPPKNFPVNEPVTIPQGYSAGAIADLLTENEIVHSSGFFYVVLLSFYEPNIQAGTYIFSEPLSVFAVARHLVNTAPQLDMVAVTLPEGFTVEEFANIVSKEDLPDFSIEEFVELGLEKEGFLFPDTYYLSRDFTATDLLLLLEDTYKTKTAAIRSKLENNSLSEYEVVTLASILEREAKDEKSMKLVAGILLNRLENSIRLQVDASIEYAIDHSLSELSAEDLDLDTPYNTYLYDGLPPTPIGNPGLTAIKAVLEPTKTDYFYYLTDDEGEFHYASTFDEHKQNIAKYLQ